MGHEVVSVTETERFPFRGIATDVVFSDVVVLVDGEYDPEIEEQVLQIAGEAVEGVATDATVTKRTLGARSGLQITVEVVAEVR